ncbi:MAG: sulfotransferase domain-containing protein [Planctomycetota bacterium]|nr:sulfotransferase domain-containing protein [Planctomycetaceae bacterium]MDQ3330919.1 sulfotransferase domain-containing protein [Planctomycetota bacterium]
MIVWLASYPRSGNTFLRVVLSAVFGLDTYTLYDERPDIDPSLGDVPPLPPSGAEPVVGHPFDVARFAGRSQLHVLKTHGPPTDGRPAIYVVRDGREATASYFHYHRDVLRKPVTVRDVIRGRVGFGSWGRHVAQWDPRHRPNTLLLRFEELTANPIAQVERIGAFLGVSPVLRRVPSFEDLHRTAPNFFRSGRTDSWKTLMSDEDHALLWELHGDEMRAFGYGGMPSVAGTALSSLLRRQRRIAQRLSEAARDVTDAGLVNARRIIASVSSPVAPPRRAA